MATVDGKDTVFRLPRLGTDRERFAFTWQGLLFPLTGLPQGFKHSPTVARVPLPIELETLPLPQEITVMQ